MWAHIASAPPPSSLSEELPEELELDELELEELELDELELEELDELELDELELDELLDDPGAPKGLTSLAIE